MTVTSTTSTATLLGNGSGTVLPLGFSVLSQDELQVFIVDGTVTPTVTTQLTAAQYQLLNPGATPSLVITDPSTSQPLIANKWATANRILVLQQKYGFSVNNFNPALVETALDYQAKCIQQLQAQIDRSVKVAVGASPDAYLANCQTAQNTAQAAAATAAAAATSASTSAATAQAAAASLPFGVAIGTGKVPLWNGVSWTGVSPGNFSGPGMAASGNLVSFSDTSGGQGSDSGVPAANVVTNAGTATNGALAIFANGSGKVVASGPSLATTATANAVPKARSDGTLDPSFISCPEIPVRQTVLSGDANSSGAAAFLTVGAGLTPAFTATNPLILAFANGFGQIGAVDLVAKLAIGGNTAACSANLLSYLYAVYSSATAVTWGATLAPVQYGPAYNQAAQASLTLNNSSLDDFGNSWTNTSVTFTSSSPMLSGSYMGVFNGSSSKMSSAAFPSLAPLGNGGWSMRTWFKTPVNNAAQAVMSAVNASGYGAVVYLSNGGNILVDLSSTGSTRDIANAVSVAPYAANTAYFVELTYDPIAGKYYLYVNGTGYTVATSALKIGAISTVSLGYGGPISGGYLGGGSTAWAQGLEILPYCQHPAGTSYSVPTALASVATAGYASDWFDTTNMAMKSPSAASTAAGSNPTFTTSSKLYVGEAIAGASAISSVVSYALVGRWDSGWVTAPALATPTSYTHNVGIKTVSARLQAICIAAEQVYAMGDVIDVLMGATIASNQSCELQRLTSRTMMLRPGSSYFLVGLTSASATVALTPANWQIRLFVDRGF